MTLLPISIIEYISSFSDSIWVMQRSSAESSLSMRINKKSSFINTLERIFSFKLKYSYYIDSIYSPNYRTIYHIIPWKTHFYEYKYQITFDMRIYRDLYTGKTDYVVYSNENISNVEFIYKPYVFVDDDDDVLI